MFTRPHRSRAALRVVCLTTTLAAVPTLHAQEAGPYVGGRDVRLRIGTSRQRVEGTVVGVWRRDTLVLQNRRWAETRSAPEQRLVALADIRAAEVRHGDEPLAWSIVRNAVVGAAVAGISHRLAGQLMHGGPLLGAPNVQPVAVAGGAVFGVVVGALSPLPRWRPLQAGR
jgi:hypothetical protein